jgi:hypothetical protein
MTEHTAPDGQLDTASILASVAETLRAVVHPAIGDPYVAGVVAQLIGLVDLARTGTHDPLPERTAALEAVLHSLAGNALVAPHWPGSDAWSAASAALVATIDANDDAAATEVRAALRPLLIAQLDADLAEHMPLMDGFRGKVRNA